MISVVLILGGLGYLAFGHLGKNLIYFYTPSEVMALPHEYHGRKIRVGGMVVPESLQMLPGALTILFQLTDGRKAIAVRHEGTLPDLFKEGQGAVVEGFWSSDQVFHSQMILAKHSEDYMPIEMKDAGAILPKKDLLKTLQED